MTRLPFFRESFSNPHYDPHVPIQKDIFFCSRPFLFLFLLLLFLGYFHFCKIENKITHVLIFRGKLIGQKPRHWFNRSTYSSFHAWVHAPPNMRACTLRTRWNTFIDFSSFCFNSCFDHFLIFQRIK